MSQIRSIQVLRAVAALLVAFGHLQAESVTMAAAASSGYRPILLDLTGAGVDLFFIISGFVMVYASQDLFERAGGGQLFLRRRVARIVPLYWAVTTVFLLTMMVIPHALATAAPTWIEILQSYLFIPYAHAGSDVMQPVYKLGWTLNYEMFFYLVFALVMFLPMRWAVYGIAVAFACLVAIGALVPSAPGVVIFWTHPIILEFVMGAFIAMAYLHEWRLPIGLAALLFAAGLCGFALTVMAGPDAHGPWRPLLWGLPAAAIVAAAVCKGETAAPAGRVMIFFVALGDASYALYLLHPMVIRVLRLIWDRFGLSVSVTPWIFIALGFVLVVPISMIIHVWIEKPMTKSARRLFGPRRPTVAAASV
jgi:peptidoglycan/LPS O-acetylase OafA/YrhL